MNRDDVFIDSGLLLFHNFRGNCIDANIIHREEEEKFLIFGMEDEYRYFLIIEESKIIIYRDRGEEEKFLKFSLMENEYQHL